MSRSLSLARLFFFRRRFTEIRRRRRSIFDASARDASGNGSRSESTHHFKDIIITGRSISKLLQDVHFIRIKSATVGSIVSTASVYCDNNHFSVLVRVVLFDETTYHIIYSLQLTTHTVTRTSYFHHRLLKLEVLYNKSFFFHYFIDTFHYANILLI